MRKSKVLIVDDSVVYRSQIRKAIEGLSNLEIVGTASNGRLASERLKASAVDLVILDLEMPEMDGLSFLQESQEMIKKGCKVIVFSSHSKRGAEITLNALRLGASDFVTKPNGSEVGTVEPSERIRALLQPKIEGLFLESKSHVVHQQGSYKKSWDLFRPWIIVIGCSTGGPSVLEKIFSLLKGPLNCPVVIVQHMPPIFTAALAARLEKISGIHAVEAISGMSLESNKIYVAPGDFHLELVQDDMGVKTALNQSEPIHFVRPAVDPLFLSAAQIYGSQCLGVILTGMGVDGRDGAKSISEKNGRVVIQSRETCVVFGMPGAVYEAGCYDSVCSPEEIATLINEKVGEP